MRWTWVFVYIALVAFGTTLLALLLGWSGWLLTVVIVLTIPVVIGIGIAMREAVQWTAVLSWMSAIALLGAIASQWLGWSSAREWFLLLWIALLPAVVVALLSHPMRRPGLALFVAFWAMVAVGWLLILQILRIADVVQGGAYTGSASWPLAALGIWFVLASASGYGARPFGAVIDTLGVLAGAAFIAISITTWADMPTSRQVISVIAAAGYCVWIGGIGWILLGLEARLGAHPGPRISVPRAMETRTQSH